MSNSIDLIVSEEAQKGLDSLIEKLRVADELLIKTSTDALTVNNNLKGIKTPNDLNKAVENNEKERSSIIKLQQDREKAFDKYEAGLKRKADLEDKARLSEIKLQQDREKAFNVFDKNAAKEAQILAKAEGTYQRYQNSVKLLLQTYNDLAIRKELGGNLTIKEEAQLLSLTNRLNLYQNALKKVDATIGNHQREVGNYAKANSNLSNSIGQISRELPNFGQSFQIGVLSLTNNVGALIDSIKQVKSQNAELESQGKKGASVFTQLLSSIFSWQTALFIGIGIFSAYSKEIGNWVSSLFNGQKGLDELSKAQDDFNKQRLASSAKTAQEIDNIREYIKIAKNADKAFTPAQTIVAFQKLRAASGSYFNDLKDSEIFTQKGTNALYEFTKAIEALAKKEDLLSANSGTKKRIGELQAEIDARKKYEDDRRSLINDINANKTNPAAVDLLQKELDLLEESNDARKERRDKLDDETLSTKGTSKIQAQLNDLILEESSQRKSINKATEESIILDYKKEKAVKKEHAAKKERILLTFDEVKSEYELKLAILERQKAEIADRMNNESSTLNARVKARQEFSDKSIEILNLELKKEKAIFEEKAIDDIAKNNLALKNKELSLAQYYKNIKDINDRLGNEQEKSEVNASLKFSEIINADLAFYKKVQEEKKYFSQKTTIAILDAEIKRLKKITEDTSLETGKTLEIKQAAFREELKLERKKLDLEKIKALAASKSDEETANILQKFKALNAELDELEQKESPLAKAREDYLKFEKSIKSGFIEKGLDAIGLSSLKIFTVLDENGKSTFKKLLAGTKTYSEQAILVAQTVGDVFQEMFNLINQASQANFDAERTRLDNQTKLAILYAGESDTAKAEIERQAEKRKRDIDRREARAKKQMAIFNIAIDTAQAVVAAFKDGFVKGIVQAAIIAAIGLAEIAVVSSQNVPAYWKGGTHEQGGLAMMNDDPKGVKGSNFREVAKTPDGKIITPQSRNAILNLPKGTEIFENYDSFLNAHTLNEPNILQSYGILNAQNKGSNQQAVTDAQINRIVNAVGSIPVADFDMTDGDLKRFVRLNGKREQTFNARLRGTPRKING